MSVDSPTAGTDGPSLDIGCSLCGNRLGEDGRFLTCYPEAEGTAPSPAADDGLLGLCGECASEVSELVAAWADHTAPPVDDDWTIGAGYRRIADDCSFCDRGLDEDPVLGVEYYPQDAAYDDAEESGSNYSLCAGCGPVFEEFLDQVGDD